MSGASVGCSQPRPYSEGKTLRRCRKRRETDNIVLIDVDSDSFNNVIIIDVPESLQNKFRGSSVLRNDGKGPWATVICLDDDEGTDDNNANIGGKVDEKVNNGASSSKRAYPVSDNFASSSNSVADDCEFIRENGSPVKLSKGKRTYSGKCSTNRYGLGADTESGSSDSDYLDCELMEGPFGRLREQWERASSKRKCDTRNFQSGTKDSEMAFSGAHQNVNVANERGQPQDTAFVDKESKEKEAPAHSIPKGDGNLGCSSSKSKKAVVDNDVFVHKNTAFVDNVSKEKEAPAHSIPKEDGNLGCSSSKSKKTVVDNDVFVHKNMAFVDNESKEKEAPAHSIAKGDSNLGCSSSKSKKAVVDNDVFVHKDTAFVDNESNEKEAPAHSILKGDGNLGCSSSKSKKAVVDNYDLLQSVLETRFPDGKADPPCRRDSLTKETPFYSNEHHSDQHFEEGGPSFYNEKEQVHHRPDSIPGHERGTKHVNHVEKVLQNKEMGSVAESDQSRAVPCGEKNLYNGKANSVEKEPSMSQCQNPVDDEVDHGQPISGDKGKISQESIIDNSTTNTNCHVNKVQPVQSHPCSVSGSEELVKFTLNSGDVILNSEDCILSEREKLKETDEYKKALEEELASRQRALQIQAEEAQNLRRLRKRRKAERLRLLDMEKRQKQRVEEIRETQKKVEENMSLKEVIRAAVRKELNELELTCHDMASVLRGLGILVGVAGQHPSSNEVRLAYKRALLTFHPDRASRSDIRQQVEAEEKFKLISRMKDKFLPT